MVSCVCVLSLLHVLLYPIMCSVRTFKERDEIAFIVRSFGVLPIEIKSVKSVLAQERNGAEDEGLTGVTCCRHLLEFGRAERPPTCTAFNRICTF